MAELLGSLLVRLGLESGAFKSGLDASTKQFKQAQKQFEKIGASMADVGKKMTLGITLPMAAMAGQAIAGAKDQAKAMAQVEAALTSMGAVSGKTADELAKTADAMEMKSLFDADVILTKVTANLLTFGNVAGDVFDRAQQSAIDMAQRMGSDPQGAAIMLGKALNDPIKGITALTRVGVQFTAAQKAQIEAFTKTGQVARAQGIILGEVERQFAGAAEAAANEEPWRKAEVVWNQAMDKIGEALLPIIPVVGDAIAKIADAFANLSPQAQKFIIVAAGIAAALGPVIFIVGQIVSLAAPLAAALTTAGAAAAAAGTGAAGASTGFAALAVAAAPWIAAGAAIAGVGYLIYQNWDKIAPVLESVWEAISSTLGPPLQQIISTVSAMFTELWRGPLGEWLRTVVSQLGTLAAAFARTFGPVVLGVLKVAFTMIGNGLRALLEVGRAVGSLFQGDVSGAFEHLGRAINSWFGGLPAKVIGWMAQLVTGVRSWLVDRLNAVWDWVAGKIETVRRAFFNLYDAVVGHSYIPDMVDQIGQHMRRLDVELAKPAKDASDKAEAAFRAMQERVRGIMARLFPDMAAQNQYLKDMADINAEYDAQLEKVKKGSAEELAINRKRMLMLEGLRREMEGLANIDPRIFATVDGGKTLEEVSADIAGRAGEALGKVGKSAEVMKVRVVESFSGMVEGALGQLDRLINGIKSGGFLDIIEGIFGTLDKFGSLFTNGKGFNIGGLTFGNTGVDGALAGGGPAMAGRSYLVGEEGPEIFTPHISGSVIPNDGIGRGGGIAQIVPSPYFDVVVNGHVMRAGPGIAEAGAARAHEQSAFASNWKLA